MNTPIDLGTFALNTSSFANFNPVDFKLSVNFIAPRAGTMTFSADLSGIVSFKGNSSGGLVTVDFLNNGPKHFRFSNAQGSGSFDLSITDVTLANSSTGSIWGTISAATFATTPEPRAIVLTTVFLGGLLIIFRKRVSNC